MLTTLCFLGVIEFRPRLFRQYPIHTHKQRQLDVHKGNENKIIIKDNIFISNIIYIT